MTLDAVPLGQPVRLASPRVPEAQALRMAVVGLRPGAEVVPLQRTSGGGRILGIGEARLALSRAALRRLPVENAG